eukprot:11424179-Alexandrium_andersonii.AAC.1
MSEIQERLWHRSDASTRRYKNATRYLAELHRLPEETTRYGNLVDKDLSALMLRNQVGHPPPGVAQPAKPFRLRAAAATPLAGPSA